MTQARLNHLTLCYVYKKVLDDIDIKKIAKVNIPNVVAKGNVFKGLYDKAMLRAGELFNNFIVVSRKVAKVTFNTYYKYILDFSVESS